jgi:hypothetical protein
LTPLRWAKVFLWAIPAEIALTRYFGRCLGGVASGIVFACFRLAPHPEGCPVLFEFLAVVCGLMTAVHVVGALEKAQPWTETAEIFLYGALTAATLFIRSTLPGA